MHPLPSPHRYLMVSPCVHTDAQNAHLVTQKAPSVISGTAGPRKASFCCMVLVDQLTRQFGVFEEPKARAVVQGGLEECGLRGG